MTINVDDLQDLVAKYPELKQIQDVTDQIGEKNPISEICDVIGQMYQRFDAINPVIEVTDSVDE